MSAIATMPMTPAKPSDSVATAGIVNAGRRARDRRMWRMSKVNTRARYRFGRAGAATNLPADRSKLPFAGRLSRPRTGAAWVFAV